jgi:hypothetical protein
VSAGAQRPYGMDLDFVVGGPHFLLALHLREEVQPYPEVKLQPALGRHV